MIKCNIGGFVSRALFNCILKNGRKVDNAATDKLLGLITYLNALYYKVFKPFTYGIIPKSLRIPILDTRNYYTCSFKEFMPFCSKLFYFSSLKAFAAFC